jgi:hypothetical protein
MAPMIDCGVALLVSTDAVIVRADADLDSDGLRALRSVGSDMTHEAEGDAVFVARSRLYAVLQRADAVRSKTKPLAQDETWAVVKIARHAVPGSQTEAAADFLACLREGSGEAAPHRKRKRLLKASEAARRGSRVNEEILEERRYLFTWDNKRRLVDRDVNPFTGLSATVPSQKLERLLTTERLQRLVTNATLRRRRRKVSKRLLGKAVGMLLDNLHNYSLRAIEKATGIPRSTLFDLRKTLDLPGRKQLLWKRYVEAAE